MGVSLPSQRCPISEPPKLTIPKSPCKFIRCVVLKAPALKSACLGSNPTSRLPDCFLGKFLDLSKPHFSHPWNGNNHSVHLQCHNEWRTHDKHSISVGYCYCYLILTCILAFSFFLWGDSGVRRNLGMADRYLGLNPGLKSLVSCGTLGRSFCFSRLTSTSVKLGCHSRLAEVLQELAVIHSGCLTHLICARHSPEWRYSIVSK